MEPTRLPRRWWQRWHLRLSVRALLALVLIIGGGLSYLVHRARVQRDAVAAIRGAGGEVYYDWGWADGQPIPDATSHWPQWLVRAVGPDFLDAAVAVEMVGFPADGALLEQVGGLDRLESLNLHGSQGITDAELAHLADLTALRDLDLGDTGATGAGLRHLADLPRLRKLILLNNPIADADLAHLATLISLEDFQVQNPTPTITDAGLAHLTGLINLRTLELESPGITSAGLASLGRMEHLTTLTLGNCGIADLTPIRHLSEISSLSLHANPLTDTGIAPVAGLRALNKLMLANTSISDVGVASLRSLDQLTVLSLSNTRTTDAGLAALAGLAKLEELWLIGTPISDAGLPYLAGLKAGGRIYVSGNRITAAGAAAAQRIQPQVAIIRLVL